MFELGEGLMAGLIAAACLGGIVAVVILAVRSANKWLAEFLRQAGRLGWQKVDDPARAPSVVAEAARSRRSVFLLYHEKGRIWLSWHRWTETSTSSGGRSTSQTHNLTRYFVA